MASINGLVFYNMVLSGMNNLHNFERDVNRMNVFPVADGDTGTNMLLTMMGGYQYAQKDKHLGKYIVSFARGSLLGARGNSGVILSQIFKGMSVELNNCGIVNPGEMANAFLNGYKMAYKAVLDPVEGTILTVARIAIDNIINSVKGKMTMKEFFTLYYDELLEVLKTTPEYLKVLKDANVVDSGAYGYVKIIEGMLSALDGNIIEPHDEEFIQKMNEEYLANENISSRYCLNFLLQLMHGEKYQKSFSFAKFNEDLKGFGNISNIFKDGSTIKVRIYTDQLDELISYVHQYGEFASFNLENNSVNKEQKVVNKLPYKKLYIVAVSDSSAMDEKLQSYGADVLIRGNKSHSPSTKDFIDALSSIEADKIVVFPNDENFVETIRQAVSLAKIKNVEIINSYDVIVSYYALMMDIPDDTTSNRIVSFKESISNVDYINIYRATRDLNNESFSCKEGDVIATLNKELVFASSNHLDTLKNTLEHVENIEDKVGMLVVINNNDEVLFNKVESFLLENYSDIEAEVFQGDNELIDIKVGVF